MQSASAHQKELLISHTVSFLILGMHYSFPRPRSCNRRYLPYLDGLRHGQVGKSVDDRGAYVGLSRTMTEQLVHSHVLRSLEEVRAAVAELGEHRNRHGRMERTRFILLCELR